MYAVIFKASVAELDDEYSRMAERLKKLAFEKYGCQDFVSVTQGNEEIAISYWETEQQIHDWKQDPEHRLAQTRGRQKWYKSFSIDICKVIKKR
ncbi:MAG: antibiotic biosynthesis monooxygenase [Xanthomonadales bacterium]|nr:antibiotic biosynthesis monooxygenase [Xanthomonadales bacterium]